MQQHVQRSFRNARGSTPTDVEFRELLSLIWVETLDVEESGAQEREAKSLLRRSVLLDAEQPDAAWAKLIERCAQYARRRSGGDRLALQRCLLDSKIGLAAVRSFESDIGSLRSRSQTTTQLLTKYSRIQIGETCVEIRRPAVGELTRLADVGSLLVVGEPGAGKSGVLHDFVEALCREERDAILLAADDVSASSLSGLRAELHLEHDVVEVLQNWPGTEPGFLALMPLMQHAQSHTQRRSET